MKFEEVHVPYMLNQAKLNFFKVANYPCYRVEDGRLVEDRSESAMKFRNDASELFDLMKSLASRIDRNMAIPKTWLRTLRTQGMAMVMSLEVSEASDRTWVEHYYRCLRFLDSYSPAK